MVRPLLALAFVWVLGGCVGERVEDLTTDAAPADVGSPGDAADTGTQVDATDTGTCAPVPGNLVPNASFEDTITDWEGLESANGGADDCARWARLSVTKPWGRAQLKIPIAGNTGDVFEFGASVQRLDDVTDGVDIFLLTPTSLPEAHAMKPLPTRGKWERGVATLKLTAPVEFLLVGVGSNTDVPRVMGVDRVWVVKK